MRPPAVANELINGSPAPPEETVTDVVGVVSPPGGSAPDTSRERLTTRSSALRTASSRRSGGVSTPIGASTQRPLAVARLEARGGPGSCFSCGDALDHSEGYGRCFACDIAADVFYAEQPEDSEVVA